MRKYHQRKNCHWCLCEICTRIGCPKFSRRYDFEFCFRMEETDRCPTMKCDFFHHKEIKPALRILRREPMRDKLLAKLMTLEEKLDRLMEKL